MKITPIIGLEVHVELKTKSKMFCGCDAHHFHVEPNTHTCPACLGLPGALPVPNKTACEYCIKLGLALGCSINEDTFFERKNYFYPDLAKGYQITQLQKPFAINGQLKLNDSTVRINRAHMEEDTGKSVHQTIEDVDSTLLDFNRSGVPLVEIVSEPDIHSAADAKEYLIKIQQIVRYLGISDADIEKGSMRCEPTINLEIEDESGKHYTPLAEIKNVASLTGVMTAIDFEIERQTQKWQETKEEKSKTNKTTRGWDADKQVTFLQRSKEGSADYRYFPEPDIPPVHFSQKEIEAIKKTLPELPAQKLNRYQTDFSLSDYDASLLTETPLIATAYDSALGSSKDSDFAKFVANQFLGTIKTHLNESQEELDPKRINHHNFLSVYQAYKDSKLSSSAVKQVILESYLTGKEPLEIAKDKALIQNSDSSAIESLAKLVIAANPKAVEDYQKNPLSIGFLIGQLMKESKGSANPQMAKEILEKLLK